MADSNYFLKDTKKILVFLVIVFAFLGLIIVLIQNSSSNLRLDKRFYELFGNFTPYMRDYVILHLEAIDCNPTSYYYENNYTICFSCGNYDACFGFRWVNRTNGKKMNPSGDLYLSGDYSRIDIFNLLSHGVTKILDCQYENDSCCVCNDMIHAVRSNSSNEIIFILPKEMNSTEYVRENILYGFNKEYASVRGILVRPLFISKRMVIFKV